MRELNVRVTTHGRILVDAEAGTGAPLRLLVGFHGYAQNADEMMEMLQRIPAGDGWIRVSVQALHRFYRGRSGITVASWMTRQDRASLIADNVAYVDAAIAEVAGTHAVERLVYCGFSQGVAMAFRAAVRGVIKADAVLALGGDVPPELLADAGVTFPRVLLARGTRDEWYAAARLESDQASLENRGVSVETLTFDGAHEWHADFSARAGAFLEKLVR